MAGSINKVILVGNLGRDPEVRHTAAGAKIVHLSVATSDVWKDKSGERQEKTEWHRVVIFNPNLADFAERALKKGWKDLCKHASSKMPADKTNFPPKLFWVPIVGSWWYWKGVLMALLHPKAILPPKQRVTPDGIPHQRAATNRLTTKFHSNKNQNKIFKIPKGIFHLSVFFYKNTV